MPLIRLLLLTLGLAMPLCASARPGLFSPAQGLADEGLLSVDEALQLLPATRRQQELTLEWNIAPGYYLYRHRFSVEVLDPAFAASGQAAAVIDNAALSNEADGRDWAAYGRTFSEQRFSPLTQINDRNVGELELAWEFKTGDRPGEGPPARSSRPRGEACRR